MMPYWSTPSSEMLSWLRCGRDSSYLCYRVPSKGEEHMNHPAALKSRPALTIWSLLRHPGTAWALRASNERLAATQMSRGTRR